MSYSFTRNVFQFPSTFNCSAPFQDSDKHVWVYIFHSLLPQSTDIVFGWFAIMYQCTSYFAPQSPIACSPVRSPLSPSTTVSPIMTADSTHGVNAYGDERCRIRVTTVLSKLSSRSSFPTPCMVPPSPSSRCKVPIGYFISTPAASDEALQNKVHDAKGSVASQSTCTAQASHQFSDYSSFSIRELSYLQTWQRRRQQKLAWQPESNSCAYQTSLKVFSSGSLDKNQSTCISISRERNNSIRTTGTGTTRCPSMEIGVVQQNIDSSWYCFAIRSTTYFKNWVGPVRRYQLKHETSIIILYLLIALSLTTPK